MILVNRIDVSITFMFNILLFWFYLKNLQYEDLDFAVFWQPCLNLGLV